MSMRGSNERNRSGYFLPADGQRRLARLCESMRLLSRAAQPRTWDEARTGTPEVHAEALATSLELLAKQADMVLAQMSWPAYREAATDAPGRAAEAAPHAPDGLGRRFAFGVTLDQIDMLDRLVQMISAHGDVLAASRPGTLADRTLPRLGQAIFDGANAVRDILDRVETQRLGACMVRMPAWARRVPCTTPGSHAWGRTACLIRCRHRPPIQHWSPPDNRIARVPIDPVTAPGERACGGEPVDGAQAVARHGGKCCVSCLAIGSSALDSGVK